jgi:hypothetical protein
VVSDLFFNLFLSFTESWPEAAGRTEYICYRPVHRMVVGTGTDADTNLL